RLHNLIDSRSLIRIVRRGIATSVATARLNVITMAAVSSPRSESSMGTITIVGTVKIDGQNALSGQTLFSGSNIVTSAGSVSLIEFGNFARLKLDAECDSTVDSPNRQISSCLQWGQLTRSVH